MDLVAHELGVYPGWFSVDSLYGGMFVTLGVFAPKLFKLMANELTLVQMVQGFLCGTPGSRILEATPSAQPSHLTGLQ